MKINRNLPGHFVLTLGIALLAVHFAAGNAHSTPASINQIGSTVPGAPPGCETTRVFQSFESTDTPLGFLYFWNKTLNDYLLYCDGSMEGSTFTASKSEAEYKYIVNPPRPGGGLLGGQILPNNGANLRPIIYVGIQKSEQQKVVVYDRTSAQVDANYGKYFDGPNISSPDRSQIDNYFEEYHADMVKAGNSYRVQTSTTKSNRYKSPTRWGMSDWSKKTMIEKGKYFDALSTTLRSVCSFTISGQTGLYSETEINIVPSFGGILVIGGFGFKALEASYKTNAGFDDELFLMIDYNPAIRMTIPHDPALRTPQQAQFAFLVNGYLGTNCALVDIQLAPAPGATT